MREVKGIFQGLMSNAQIDTSSPPASPCRVFMGTVCHAGTRFGNRKFSLRVMKARGDMCRSVVVSAIAEK